MKNSFVQIDKIIGMSILEELKDDKGIDSTTALALYYVLLWHRNQNNGKCYPSRKVLMQKMHKSLRTIDRTLSALESHGFITVNTGRQHTSSTYYFPREEFDKENPLEKVAEKKSVAFVKEKKSKQKQIETFVTFSNEKIF